MWIYNNYELSEKDVNFFFNWVKNVDILGVDTETTGMHPMYAELLLIQIGNLEYQWVFTVNDFVANLERIKEVLLSRELLFFNAQFDLKWLYHYGIFPEKVFDVFLAEVILNTQFNFAGEKPTTGLGLKDVAMKYVGQALDKSIRGRIHKHSIDNLPDEIIKYAAEDVMYLETIRDLQMYEIQQKDQVAVIEFENRFVKALAWRLYKGLPIDNEAWLENSKTNKIELISYERKLDDLIVKVNKKYFHNVFLSIKNGKKVLESKLDLFKTDADRHTLINWSSSKQMIELFKKEFNIKFEDKEGKTTVNGNVIKLGKRNIKSKEKLEFLEAYLEYKEKEKETSTYGESFIKNYVKKGYVYSSVWQIRDTSRQSSKDPNTQNIPQSYRKFFIAPEGHKFITADYSSQEPRVTANKSNDPVLIDFIMNGDGDLHNLVSSIISGHFLDEEIKVDKNNNPLIPAIGKKIRDIGKAINLGLDYGKTGYSLGIELNCSTDVATELINVVKRRFSVKFKYLERATEKFIRDGYITTNSILKRRVYIKDIDYIRQCYADGEVTKRLGQVMRACQNYPTQGTAADMTKYAEILCYERMDRNKAWVCNSVHDELDVIAEDGYIEEAYKIIKEAMLEAGRKFCTRIPMKIEPIIGDRWLKD